MTAERICGSRDHLHCEWLSSRLSQIPLPNPGVYLRPSTMSRSGGGASGVKAPRSARRAPVGLNSVCIEGICRAFAIPSAPTWPSRGCSTATTTFKRALKDSGTRVLGLIEESGTLQRYGQGRVEDLEGSADRCLRLSDLTTARSNRRPNTRESLPPIN